MKKTMTIICACLAVLLLGIPCVQAQETKGSTFGIFMNLGFGYVHNLRMADWLNATEDWAKLNPLIGAGAEVKEKQPIGCGGFDLESRFFWGNLVLGPSLGYYGVSEGSRDIRGASANYYSALKLKMWSLRSSLYYKIVSNSGNYILLGGGLGFYGGKLAVTRTKAIGIGLEDRETFSDNKWTVGWHSQIEYDWTFGGSWVLNVGLMNRFAYIYNFKVKDNGGNPIFDAGGGLTGLYLYFGAGYMF